MHAERRASSFLFVLMTNQTFVDGLTTATGGCVPLAHRGRSPRNTPYQNATIDTRFVCLCDPFSAFGQ